MKRLFVLTMLLVLILSGCGGGSGADSYASSQAASAAPSAMRNDYGFATDMQEMLAEEEALDMEEPETGGGADPGATVVPDQPRKIIQNASLTLQTREFDAGVDRIPQLTEQFNGFVQSSYTEGKSLYDQRGSRSASFTLRIPSERLGEFLNVIGDGFNVIGKQMYSNDITGQYYDSQARLNSLQIQEAQLLEMLEQAAELQYLLEVQRELANVRYEIESIQTQLNRMDSDVQYSTVDIRLEEVVEYTALDDQPATFGERASLAIRDSWAGFVDFIQGAIIVLIMLLPFLVVLAVILIVVVLIIKAVRKRTPKREVNYQQKQDRRNLDIQNKLKPDNTDDDPQA